jgi:hypothetical protein
MDTMEEDFLEQTRGREIDLVVCSDGEAILGIGDQGVGVRDTNLQDLCSLSNLIIGYWYLHSQVCSVHAGRWHQPFQSSVCHT